MITFEISAGGWTIAGVIASFLIALVALGLGVSSYLQTRETIKREHRDKILNDISKWATDLGAYLHSRNLEPFEKELLRKGKLDKAKLEEYYDSSIEEQVIAKIGEFRMKSVQIEVISEKINDRSLKEEFLPHVKTATMYLKKKRHLLSICHEKDLISGNRSNISKGYGEYKEKVSILISRNEDKLYSALVEIIRSIGGNI